MLAQLKGRVRNQFPSQLLSSPTQARANIASKEHETAVATALLAGGKLVQVKPREHANLSIESPDTVDKHMHQSGKYQRHDDVDLRRVPDESVYPRMKLKRHWDQYTLPIELGEFNARLDMQYGWLRSKHEEGFNVGVEVDYTGDAYPQALATQELKLTLSRGT
ncbi:hypothetical protein BDQ17DRAFT_1335819 [Cyathus striatus]|nr:hypothetical protein BDQ17DRAFT_1335819 [Cyathus striatus]